MLDLSRLDLDEITHALSDQTDYEHRWLINPDTGEIVFWTSDTGIDGKTPVDLDELPINPLPSYVWYQDMADFAEMLTSLEPLPPGWPGRDACRSTVSLEGDRCFPSDPSRGLDDHGCRP